MGIETGDDPGSISILNYILSEGGTPGNVSGKTSAKSRITGGSFTWVWLDPSDQMQAIIESK